MNHKKIIIGLLIAIVVAVVILFSISAAKAKKAKEAKEKEAAQPAANPTPTTGTPTPTPAALASDYPIVYMKYSAAAKQLQAAVGTTQDGYVGDKTLAAWNAILTKAGKRNATKAFKIESESVLATQLNEIKEAKSMAAAAQGATLGLVSGWFAPLLK